jgi:outer membrane lipoprotein-sorting protein
MRKRIFLFTAIIGLVPAILFAQITGIELMEGVYNRPKGNGMTAELVMTITNSRGSVRERSILQYQLDENGIEKKLMFFSAPADVKDTSFMTWSYDNGQADDQWIYLPAMRRIRRIASDSKNDSFMGSDFTYEDMTLRHPDLDTHQIIGQKQVQGSTYLIVESTPLNPVREYSSTRSWIDPESFVGIYKEFINSSGEVIRRLSVDEKKQVDGFWVITDMTMENLLKESSTRIQMREVAFDTGLDDSFFTERQMKKGPKR